MKTVPSKRQLAYFLPLVGRVEADLYEESADLYEAFLGVGEIARFKQMPQLGIVSHTWEGARHTRWDYISLCLHLIRVLNRDTNYKLTTGIRLPGGTTFSSIRELMQCWILLSHAGHLHWTFMAEQALLSQIVRDDGLGAGFGAQLIDSMPDGPGRDWAASVIRDGKVYQFHQLLAMFRLQKSLAHDPNLALWIDALKAHVVELPTDGSAVTSARLLFRRLRRVAYLALDSEFSPSIVKVDVARLTNDRVALERILVQADGIRDELSSLHDYLARRIYLGRRTLEETARFQQSLARKIARSLARPGLGETIEMLSRRSDMDHVTRDETIGWVTRLELDAQALRFGQDEFGSDPIATNLEAASWFAGHHGAAGAVIARDPTASVVVIQTHAKPSPSARAACLAFSLKTLSERGAPHADAFWQRILYGQPAEDLVLEALTQFFGGLRWSWSLTSQPYRALLLRTQDLREFVSAEWDRTGLPRGRQLEIDTAMTVANRSRLAMPLVAVANVLAHSYSGETIAELDGVVIGQIPNSKQLVLGIVESKSVKRSAEQKAREALAGTSKAIGNSLGASRGRIMSGGRSGFAAAWRYYRMSHVGASTTPASRNRLQKERSP